MDKSSGVEPDLQGHSNLLAAQLEDAYKLRASDLQKSIRLTEELLLQCEALRDEGLVATAKNNLGLYYLIQGEFKKAQELSEEALTFFQQDGNQKGIADAKYNIGSIHYRTNLYPQSLLLLAESLSIYKTLGDYYNQARTLKSMGTVYEYYSDEEKAIEVYEKSIEASRIIHDSSLESNSLNPLSAIYFKQGRHALAMETIERSIQLKKESGDERGLAFALYGRGKLFIKLGDAQKAVADFDKALELHLRSGDKLGLAMVYNKLGMAYMDMNVFSRAREYFNKSLELSDAFNVQIIGFKVDYNLYLLAKKEGNNALALQYLEKFISHKEAIINKESYSIIKSYEAVKHIEDLEQKAVVQQEKNQIIESKNAELDSFFYRVSHDLKGPISSLQGLQKLVEIDVTDETALSYFSMYRSQVNRIHDIVMGLIHLTQLNHLENTRTQIDFVSLINDCIESCSYIENYKNIHFIKEIKSFDYRSEWAIVSTILQNLIENAVKYSTKINPFVKISVYQTDNQAVIEVSDNGQGIDKSHQAKIFDMFFRANNQTKGSGLGLYILKRAVERLNGKIELTSKPGSGSVFKVFLPQ
ncbi:MAG: Two-component system sensor histidine kinase [Cytophagales bacterium]|jgi:signal transduction histidine kinase|nr:tetratricopeptide repeat protein [Bacteroidota bacterium]MBS1980644.1 tetratricopeptide repeat protein [Bacteroidota bacterium]WHZ07968.1 MAG: Two-component system sensor histidine kinase [Cytophagales bacterium]